MFCSWVNIEKSELLNFGMSQEVDGILQEESCPKKMNKVAIAEENNLNSTPDVPEGMIADDFVNDEMLAKMLQIQFDKEYEQNKIDTSPLNCNADNDSEEENFHNCNGENWDIFEVSEREFDSIPPQKTKTNKQDVRTDTYKLSSKVFNSLKSHSYNEEFCKYKVHDRKKRPVYKLLGIDEYTWHLIRTMIKDKIIKKITNMINFDNEVVTIRAIYNRTMPNYNKHPWEPAIVPVPCSIKVFRTTSMPYEKIRITASENAEREVANYARLREAGLPCLDVVTVKEHVLVISYLGPVLSEEKMTPYTYELVYEKVRKMMKILYEEANLIHANLSEHNIVWYNCNVYFINISQSVDASHEKAFDLLFRDCSNMVNFFDKRGVPDMEDPDDLFKYITGYSFLDKPSHS